MMYALVIIPHRDLPASHDDSVKVPADPELRTVCYSARDRKRQRLSPSVGIHYFSPMDATHEPDLRLNRMLIFKYSGATANTGPHDEPSHYSGLKGGSRETDNKHSGAESRVLCWRSTEH